MSNVKRSNEVDVIRMAALVGICIVNVHFMALPEYAMFIPPTNVLDKAAAFFVESFFQFKFFILFSFIFGWGMAIQARSAEGKGRAFSKQYFRRLLGLALFGAMHAVFVFVGDILLLYAFLGLFLWKIRNCSPSKLLKISIAMVVLSLVTQACLAVIMDMALNHKEFAKIPLVTSATLGGSYLETVQVRLESWLPTFFMLIFLQGPLAFAAFAAGLAAAKTNFFDENNRFYQRIARWLPLLLVVALPLNLFYAAVSGGSVPENFGALSFWGFTLVAIGAPVLSLVYLLVFIRISRVLSLPELFVLAGRNSLSTYVLQGVIAGLIFGGYGLGFFDKLGYGQLLLVSILIAVFSLIVIGIWVKFFGRGPLEPLLRKFSGN